MPWTDSADVLRIVIVTHFAALNRFTTTCFVPTFGWCGLSLRTVAILRHASMRSIRTIRSTSGCLERLVSPFQSQILCRFCFAWISRSILSERKFWELTDNMIKHFINQIFTVSREVVKYCCYWYLCWYLQCQRDHHGQCRDERILQARFPSAEVFFSKVKA